MQQNKNNNKNMKILNCKISHYLISGIFEKKLQLKKLNSYM